jgi:phage head maturation protease
MKRAILITGNQLFLSKEAVVSLFSWDHVFTLVRGTDGNLKFKGQVDSHLPVLEKAKGMVTRLTLNHNSQMHKVIEKFAKGELSSCEFSFNSNGSIAGLEDLEDDFSPALK